MQTESIRAAGGTAQNYPAAKSKKASGGNAASHAGSSSAGSSSTDSSGTGLWVDMDGTTPTQTAACEPDNEITRGGTEVDTRVAAVRDFTEAYNTLLDALIRDSDGAVLVESLREAVYRPVGLDCEAEHTRLISLYEIGIAHSPNRRAAGRLTVHEKKLTRALEYRETEVEALFHNSGEGLPARLRGIVIPFQTDSLTVRTQIASFLLQCDNIGKLFT